MGRKQAISIDNDKVVMAKNKPDTRFDLADICQKNDIKPSEDGDQIAVYIGAARQGLGGSGSPRKKGDLLNSYQKAAEAKDGYQFDLQRVLMLDHLLDLPKGTTFNEVVNLQQKMLDEGVTDINELEVDESEKQAYSALARQLISKLQTLYSKLFGQADNASSLPTAGLSSPSNLPELKGHLENLLSYSESDFAKELIMSNKGFYDSLDKGVYGKEVGQTIEASYIHARQDWIDAKSTLKPVADDKIQLVYTQIHDFAYQNPDDNFDFYFIDNHPGIVSNIQNFFSQHPQMLPSNCTLHCKQSVHPQHENDNDCQPVGQSLDPVQGKGDPDPHYSEMAKNGYVHKNAHALDVGLDPNSDDAMDQLSDMAMQMSNARQDAAKEAQPLSSARPG